MNISSFGLFLYSDCNLLYKWLDIFVVFNKITPRHVTRNCNSWQETIYDIKISHLEKIYLYIWCFLLVNRIHFNGGGTNPKYHSGSQSYSKLDLELLNACDTNLLTESRYIGCISRFCLGSEGTCTFDIHVFKVFLKSPPHMLQLELRWQLRCYL